LHGNQVPTEAFDSAAEDQFKVVKSGGTKQWLPCDYDPRNDWPVAAGVDQRNRVREQEGQDDGAEMTITPEAAERAARTLPGDHRWEITPEGTLQITSPANTRQAKIVKRFIVWLDSCGIADVQPEVGIHTIGDGVRGPDLAVFSEEPAEIGPWAATDALRLVIEVASPSTRHTDEHDKMREYAAVGIAHYWLAEPIEGGDALVRRYQLGHERAYVEVEEPILLSRLVTGTAQPYIYQDPH
jgi:Uma2 family endonuclease